MAYIFKAYVDFDSDLAADTGAADVWCWWVIPLIEMGDREVIEMGNGCLATTWRRNLKKAGQRIGGNQKWIRAGSLGAQFTADNIGDDRWWGNQLPEEFISTFERLATMLLLQMSINDVHQWDTQHQVDVKHWPPAICIYLIGDVTHPS